jgi:signal transduction histidine kinase
MADGIEISLETISGDLPTLHCVPSEIRELLTNLVLNAIDAIPDGVDTPAELARGGGHGVETLESKDVAN